MGKEYYDLLWRVVIKKEYKGFIIFPWSSGDRQKLLTRYQDGWILEEKFLYAEGGQTAWYYIMWRWIDDLKKEIE